MRKKFPYTEFFWSIFSAFKKNTDICSAMICHFDLVSTDLRSEKAPKAPTPQNGQTH